MWSSDLVLSLWLSPTDYVFCGCAQSGCFTSSLLSPLLSFLCVRVVSAGDTHEKSCKTGRTVPSLGKTSAWEVSFPLASGFFFKYINVFLKMMNMRLWHADCVANEAVQF